MAHLLVYCKITMKTYIGFIHMAHIFMYVARQIGALIKIKLKWIHPEAENNIHEIHQRKRE